MSKTKKLKIKNVLKKIFNKSKKLSKKLSKKTKNKSGFKKCEFFCKNDYLVEMNKVFKKSGEKWNVPYNPTKQDSDFIYNNCKKTFCNENCEGYDFYGDKKKQEEFKKKIKKNFQNTYTQDKINKLKEKGVLSGCVNVIDYDPFHN
jgi:hypothetical protein